MLLSTADWILLSVSARFWNHLKIIHVLDSTFKLFWCFFFLSLEKSSFFSPKFLITWHKHWSEYFSIIFQLTTKYENSNQSQFDTVFVYNVHLHVTLNGKLHILFPVIMPWLSNEYFRCVWYVKGLLFVCVCVLYTFITCNEWINK